jgi:hypothetical protein
MLVFDIMHKGASGVPNALFEPNENIAQADLVLNISFLGETIAT